jgi:hypothetical protein
VASLRAALDPLPAIAVEHRHLPAQPVRRRPGRGGRGRLRRLLRPGLRTLYGAVRRPPASCRRGRAAPSTTTGGSPTSGARSWPTSGPRPERHRGRGRASGAFPPSTSPSATHAGPFVDFDRTYGALGRHVNEHCGSSGAAIREVLRHRPRPDRRPRPVPHRRLLADRASPPDPQEDPCPSPSPTSSSTRSNPTALAGFWSGVVERPVDDGASEFFATVGMAERGAPPMPTLMFLQVSDPTPGKNRVPPRPEQPRTGPPRSSGSSPWAPRTSVTSTSTAPSGRRWPTPRATSSTSPRPSDRSRGV